MPPASPITVPHRGPARAGVAAPPGLEAVMRDLAREVGEQAAARLQAQIAAHIQAQVQVQVHAQVEAQVQARLAQRVQELFEQLVLSRRRQFGRSSEAHVGQARLFDEADALAAGTTELDEVVPLPAAPARGGTERPAGPRPSARGKRGPLPSELPRIDIVHEVPESERTCACGTPMVQIGEEVSEQLDIVPMQVRVLRHIRKRYACPGGEQAPVTAPVAPQVLPKSNASNDLLAMLLTVKYVDGLPLARFEHVLARSGITVPRQTLARWVIGTAQALQPIHNLLRDHLLSAPVLHMDETTVQVLKEPGKAASSTSYMWVQTGGPPDRPVVIYDYDASRSGQVPQRLLEGWQGFLMTDGYEGYGAVARTPGVEHMACWAHARRRFVEAVKVQPSGKRGRADEAIALIGQLYRIERDLKDVTDAQRQAGRQARSVPVLAELRAWLDKTRPQVPPSLALGKALAYLDRYWDKLVRYLERGDLPIDNNRCEGAIRPFVVGRKGWLFSDTPAGAHASALIYSLVETAKANGREPYTWLRRVLRELPTAKTVEDYEALLPWNLHPQDLAMETVGA
ncbi:transposase [Pigmentiphaga sp. NML030171]|nr:transposase [Pigmentiphaga sp. NML030171]